MKDVLVLSFYFPPFAGIEVVRAVKWVKYLPEHGWRPIVLSTATTGEVDPRMASDLRGVEILRTSKPELQGPQVVSGAAVANGGDRGRSGNVVGTGGTSGRQRVLPVWLKRALQSTVFFPDRYRAWIKEGRGMVPRLRQEFPEIRAVVATGYPWSAYLLAEKIARELNVPFLCDLRDAWTLNPSRVWNTWRHRRREARAFRAADGVIFATESMREEYLTLYPELITKSYVIRNGYDPEDREEAQILRQVLAAEQGRDKLRVVYTGTFNGLEVPPADNRQSPYYFLQALRLVKERVPDLASRLEVMMAGKVPFATLVRELGLEDVVRLPGHLPVEETLALQASADLLLLFVAPDNRHVLTGKVYEYIAAGVPILAMIPLETELHRLLRAYGNARVTEPRDVERIADHLVWMLEEHRAGGRVGSEMAEESYVASLSRREQAGELALLLEGVSAGHETARV
ncbi:MAG TPA: glycosyltransferase [Bacilli bacterium]|nr:glycosyltransferase [Bacilli bacterium]